MQMTSLPRHLPQVGVRVVPGAYQRVSGRIRACHIDPCIEIQGHTPREQHESLVSGRGPVILQSKELGRGAIHSGMLVAGAGAVVGQPHGLCGQSTGYFHFHDIGDLVWGLESDRHSRQASKPESGLWCTVP